MLVCPTKPVIVNRGLSGDRVQRPALGARPKKLRSTFTIIIVFMTKHTDRGLYGRRWTSWCSCRGALARAATLVWATRKLRRQFIGPSRTTRYSTLVAIEHSIA